MSATDFHHVRFAWATRRDAPWWMRVLTLLLRLLLIGYFTGILIFAAMTVAGSYHRMNPAMHASFARLAGGLFVLYGTMMFAASAHYELFKARDVSFLITTPQGDRPRFHLKMRRLLRTGLVLAGVATLLSFAFAFRLLLPLWTYAALFVAIVAMMGLMIGAGLALALHEPARKAYFFVCRWLIYVAFFGCLAFVAKLPESSRQVDAFMTAPRSLLGAWWPGAIAADFARAVAYHDNASVWIAAAKFVVMLVIVWIAAEALVASRYTTGHVLEAQNAFFVIKNRDEQRLAPNVSDDALAQWLRARLSPRTYALLMLLTRYEQPDVVWPRLRSLLLSISAVMIASHLWRAFLLPIDETIANFPFIIVIAVCFATLTRELTHRPAEAAYAFLRGAQIARASSGLAICAGVLPDRGNHNHPLVESWPVSLREFARVRIINDVASAAIFVVVMLAAAALAPFPFVLTGSIILAVGVLLIGSLIDAPSRHAAMYRTDYRRKQIYRLLRILALIVSGAIIGVLLVFALTSLYFILTTFESWLALIIAVLVFLGIAAFSVWFSWHRAVRHDRRHRFDAEYHMGAPFTRW